MSKYNLGEHIMLLLPITYYNGIDVHKTISIDDVTYICSTFQIVGMTLLKDMSVGYTIKDIQYGIELNVTTNFIKKYFVTRLY